MLKSALITLFLSFFALGASGAQGFDAEIIPASVHPGDAFLLRVTQAAQAPIATQGDKRLLLSSCGAGCFQGIGAVELGSAPGQYPVEVSSGGQSRVLRLKVLAKKYPVVNLTLPSSKVTLSPEDQRRVDAESRRLMALWEQATAKFWDSGFVMPLQNEFSTAFGVKRIMNNVKESVHTGIDIRGKRGEPVRASNFGKVVLAEELFYGGKTVVLDHGQAIYSLYMHMSEFRVAKGDIVKKGEVLGLVGATGRATGPHLHYTVKVGPASVNPVSVNKLPL